MEGRIFLEGNYGRLGCQEQDWGRGRPRVLPAACLWPVLCGHLSAGDCLHWARGGGLGAWIPWGRLFRDGRFSPTGHPLSSKTHKVRTSQRPLASLCSGTSSFRAEGAFLLGCPLRLWSFPLTGKSPLFPGNAVCPRAVPPSLQPQCSRSHEEPSCSQHPQTDHAIQSPIYWDLLSVVPGTESNPVFMVTCLFSIRPPILPKLIIT